LEFIFGRGGLSFSCPWMRPRTIGASGDEIKEEEE
jgi:hypothetical protein